MKKLILMSLFVTGSWISGCGGDSSIKNAGALSEPSKKLVSEEMPSKVNLISEEGTLSENGEDLLDTSEIFSQEDDPSEVNFTSEGGSEASVLDAREASPERDAHATTSMSEWTGTWAWDSSMLKDSQHVLTSDSFLRAQLTFALQAEAPGLKITLEEWRNGVDEYSSGFQIQATDNYSEMVNADSTKFEFILPRAALIRVLPELEGIWLESGVSSKNKKRAESIVRKGIKYFYAEQGELLEQNIKWDLDGDQCIASKKKAILGKHLFEPRDRVARAD
ncbi:Putative sucrose phosphorylase [Mycoavidus cysteinexigens]|uniref:Sucrose phosphorylase n=1 Tax=Mycoavidus cysteinexigens TaxID=1553431 RepID=A0A2Z6EUE2_9BURK|nr:hypothetical protein [Mycoavidus cysteinexigens]BBE09031.1 Putative sucrose phosphorylase [Mycoavidus cysteinexigens]GAM52242.1 hypothetical protein EBME_0705 [bacterium endosymbiont of Mortierella elongata FMR23-6]GLR00302.1 hypothetical protein GCM10007934_01130 [Mycoavidus cysteinexigens]